MVIDGKTYRLIFQLLMLFLVFMFFTRSALSAEITSIDLIENCQELIGIYDKKGEKRLLAGLSTSVAESMRAGICRGMLEEHSRHDSSCRGDWYEKAEKIASISVDVDVDVVKKISAETLLRLACQ